jgi:putative ABC transport system ATP-binding protein
VVLVTHDSRHAGWADRVVYLRDGRLVDEVRPPAGPESILRRERV